MSLGADHRQIPTHDLKIERFARALFSPLLRADQKRWAEVYLRGLLSVEGKKTIKKIADDTPMSSRLGAIQSLQQFINQSPWDWNPVRESLARMIHGQTSSRAWIISAAVIPKRGVHSVGVTKRFLEPEGRVMNCQVGFGALLATARGALPVDWCLQLDGEWINEREHRERTRVPEDVGLRSPADHVLAMTDRLGLGWRLPAVPVIPNVCHSGPDALKLITGLTERKADFLLEVPASLTAFADRHGAVTHTVSSRVRADTERRPAGRADATHRTIQQHTNGTRPGIQYGRSLRSLPLRIPDSRSTGNSSLAFRLLAGWAPSEGRARRFWVTNLPHQRVDELLDLSLLYRRSAADLREIRDSFGLRDFEGRSYPGWHHHVTLVSAAFGFHRLAAGQARNSSSVDAFESLSAGWNLPAPLALT